MLAAEVRVRFNKLPRMGQGLEAAVDAGLREVADAAGQASGPATPVDTGELKGTARTEQVGRMRWRRYWPASYAAYQNFGTSRGVPARHFAETGVRSVAGRAGGIVAARVRSAF